MLDANNYLGKMLAERYSLVRVVGHGASTLVFYAEDIMHRREDGTPFPVAIKLLDPESSEYKFNSDTFHNELEAVSKIPPCAHIVEVKAVDTWEGMPFVMMEYVNGRTLGSYLTEKGGPLSPKEIISISLQLLQALRYAHSVGVIHRDIKPENIIVERADLVGKRVSVPGGEGMPFVKLADFGIALLPDNDIFALKDKGVGTAYYISPEQASGGHADARSDLYSLGVLMHVMATGQVPFDAQSPTGIIAKHQTEMPHHVRGQNGEIPLALDEIIFTALQKNPANRYPDAASMERALREVLRKMEGESAPSNVENAFRGAPVSVGNDAVGVKPAMPAKLPKEKKEKAAKSAKTVKTNRKGLVIGASCAALVVLLAVLTVFLLPLLTGPKTFDITVPNLTNSVYVEGATYPEGVSIADVEYVYHDEYAAGVVISQVPSQGVVYKDVENVEITLTVSLGPEMTEFKIPAEYRVDYETASAYLREKLPYHFVSVKTALSNEVVEGAAPGSVIGAYRESTLEKLSLDGAEVYKNKSERIVLLVQPVEKVTVTIALKDLSEAATVKAFLEGTYSYLTVTKSEIAPANNPVSWMPTGTVIGAKATDDSVSAVYKQTTNVLEITFIKNKATEIVLLTAWENENAPQ